jgi:hypothetical protein
MTGRRIGRILSLGFPLPGPQVDNYNFVSAPAFFDYDVLVVDPHALSQLIESMTGGASEQTFGGETVRNAREAATDIALIDVLQRRRAEVQALLDSGGCVVCFAAPAVAHGDITGTDLLRDNYWLPDDALRAINAAMVPAEGSRAHAVDMRHPLAAFIESQGANILYRACFAPAELAGAPMIVFAQSAGGKAVGVEFRCGDGRIVFLPALRQIPSGDQRYAMSDVLQSGIRRLLGVMAEGRAPHWVDDHTLPGLDERAAALAAARQSVEEAQQTLEGADVEYEALARYRRLLWQEGALGIDDVAVEALRLIGFDPRVGADGDVRLTVDGGVVLVEVEAAEYAVGIAAHHRLRQRIERAIEAYGRAPRGLLLVNGYRLQPPGQRPRQVDDALRTAAETMRYAIATTDSLFGAVVACLSGDEAALEDYRRRITTTDGLMPA